jgi:hypothetical protein
MPDAIRAKDVTVACIYQARCQRPGCHWASDLFGDRSEAASERKYHLDLPCRQLAGENIDPCEFEPIAMPGNA